MARFLTQQWVDAFNAAMTGVTVTDAGARRRAGRPSGRFTVAQEVRGAPDGDVTLLLAVDGGRVRLALAPATEGPQPEAETMPDRTPTSPSPSPTRMRWPWPRAS